MSHSTPSVRAPRTILLGLAAAALAVGVAACTPPDGGSSGAPTGPEIQPTATSDPGGSASDDATGSASGIDGVPDDVVLAQGLPAGVQAPAEAFAGAAWSSDGASLYVTTFGSSTCPVVATGLEATGQALTVQLTQAGGAVCTADMVPVTTTIAAPVGVSVSESATATLGSLGEVTIPAASDPIAFGWVEQPAG